MILRINDRMVRLLVLHEFSNRIKTRELEGFFT